MDTVTSQTRHTLALALLATIIYIPIFLIYGGPLDSATGAFAVIPVALVGWSLGLRAGLGAGVVAVLLNLLLMGIFGDLQQAQLRPGMLPGAVILLLIGAGAGWVGTLVRRSESQAIELLRERETLREQTERRQHAEQALRESEERFRESYSAVGQVTHSLDGRFLKVNRAFCDMLGYTEAELLQLDGPEITHPDDHERSRSLIRRLLTGEISHYHLEKRLIRKDGSIVTVLLSSSLVVDAESRPQHVLAITQDITEQKRLEQERLDFERKLLETQKLESLGLLAGGIAHDFNNLLVSILGNTELALLDIPEGSPARPTLQQIELAATRAADLTRQLLAYAGKGRIAVQELELNGIVAEMPQLLKSSVPKSVRLQFQPGEGLPAIRGDVVQIRQVIMNLVLNAAEALGGREGSVTIATSTVWAERDQLDAFPLGAELSAGSYVLLEVSDEGCGMDEETQAKIFEPFFTTKFTGRGLGLSAVLGIVRTHGGALTVASEPGHGTTFRILLPAVERHAAPGAAHDASGWSGHGSVLLVEDELPGREVISRMLRTCGFTVVEASDGPEAAMLFQTLSDHVRCALVDLMMPHMSGDLLLRELRRHRPDLPVLLMSGYNEQELGERIDGVAGVRFLHKPFTLDGLREALRLLLDPASG